MGQGGVGLEGVLVVVVVVVEVLAFGMVEVVGPGGGVCTFSSRVKHSTQSTLLKWSELLRDVQI